MDIDTLEQENRQLNARNARLTTEIAIMSDFIRDLLHPEMYGHAVTPEIRDRARRVLGKAECETVANPAASAEPVALNIIRNWPDGFDERLQAVWIDVIGLIPNIKLYDLQRVLAEFGFTMLVFDGNDPPIADAKCHNDGGSCGTGGYCDDCHQPSADAKDAALILARKELMEIVEFTRCEKAKLCRQELDSIMRVVSAIDAAMQKGGA